MIAPKLIPGDEIRIIAPAESLSKKLTPKLIGRGVKRLEQLGLKVTFGKHLKESGEFDTATVNERLEDLHQAFSDSSVKAVLAANGGASANQLLKHIDYELIRENPKIFCGLSDITEITSAIHAKTGLITYYGPHFTSICACENLGQTLENMQYTFFTEETIELKPSQFYSNSEWDSEQILNPGFWTINEGAASGTCLGGNLLTLNFLLGYSFIKDIGDSILFLEENKVIDYKGINKEIQQILNHPQSRTIKGLIIGRFQRESGMSKELLYSCIKSKKELRDVPVVGNVDLGHTLPMVTFPFGGKLKLSAKKDDNVKIELFKF